MVPGASIEEWQAQAGMDYKVQRSVIRYATERDIATPDQFRTWWGTNNLPTGLKIVTYTGSGIGLSVFKSGHQVADFHFSS